MRKSDLKKNHKPFDEAVTRYREFMRRILDAKRVVSDKLEKRDLAESVLLRLCANWEKFVDEHLVDCVNRDPSLLSDFLGVDVPEHPDRQLCHALVFGDGYRDFFSFGDIVGFTKRLLPEGSNPFLAVTQTRRQRINEVFRIRNYLSHYSAKARRSLMTMYREKYAMDRFYEPGKFLLAYKGKRLWLYFDTFIGASQDMKDWY